MAEPHRVQRRRTRGWRMPANTVYVGRGSEWGNPCRSIRQSANGRARLDHARSVELYHRYLRRNPAVEVSAFVQLRGRNLACWCPLDQPCHADVLLEIANV